MDWLNSPIFTLVGLALSIVGIALTVRTNRTKEPYWSIQTIRLFEDHSSAIEGLDVRYLGEKVKDLSISTVIFGNRGGLTLDKADITEDPIRLELQGQGRILSATLLASNNQASRALVAQRSGNQVQLSFDYLDRGHAFVIRIVHDGPNTGSLVMRGSLKGVVKIKRYEMSRVPHDRIKRLIPIVLSLLAGIGYLTFTVRMLLSYWNTWSDSSRLTFGFWNLLVSGFLLYLAYALFSRFSWVPRGLQSFLTSPLNIEQKPLT